jgi:hypothetical protein
VNGPSSSAVRFFVPRLGVGCGYGSNAPRKSALITSPKGLPQVNALKPFGYTGLKYSHPAKQTKVEAMQSSSFCASFQAKATQRTLPSRTSLTVGSTRTKMLRIFAG